MDDGKLDALGQTIVSALVPAPARPPRAVSDQVARFGELTSRSCAPRDRRGRCDLPARRSALPLLSFIDVTAVDYPGREKRFDVVYHLLSPTLNTRIRVKVEADETRRCRRSSRCFPAPTGSSARPTTSTA
jgi:NADH-quinone oxidoreductase subunit C